VRELNESRDGRLKVSSPYILVLARKATGLAWAGDSPQPPGSLREPSDLPAWRGGERAARQYDAMAAEYAADNDGAYNVYYERPATIALLGDVEGRDVLEVGCGAGQLTEHLVEHGAKVTACDVSGEMVRLARTRVGDRANLLVANIEEPLSFANDGNFDIVVASLVMHYVRDWEPVLREFHRVLRPAGAVVFSTHHPTMDWELTPASYFETKQITETWKKGSGEYEVTFWRRPLTAMTHAIAASGFVIEQLVEPEPLRELYARSPRDYTDLATKPRFLFFRLRPS
jgi:ubiquinone/menaquinone biosynthesis C-methylase UbiE